MEEFKNKEKVIMLPCIHNYHPDCIKDWLKNKNTCPICKFELTEENLKEQEAKNK